MTESTTTDADEQRELTEEDVRELADEQQSVETPDGETLRLADVLDIPGLDRKKAYGVLWLASLGFSVSAGAALVSSMSSETVEAQTSTGSGTYSVDEIIANQLDTTEVQTDTLSGPLVGRTAPVDYIAGNLNNTSERPSSPDNNDVLFRRGGSS